MEPGDEGVVCAREGCGVEKYVITLYVTEEEKGARARDLDPGVNTGVILHRLVLRV